MEIKEPFFPSTIGWFSIVLEEGPPKVYAERIENEDSLKWNVSIIEAGLQYSDSVRIIIKDSDSELFDVSGWYFSVSEDDGLLGRTSMGSAVINRGKLKRPGKSR